MKQTNTAKQDKVNIKNDSTMNGKYHPGPYIIWSSSYVPVGDTITQN